MIGLLSSMALALSLHVHHTSVCDVTYNAQNETLEVVQQVFVEDLEHALSMVIAGQIDLYADDKEVVSNQLQEYMKGQLAFSTGDKEYPQTWIGHKLDGGYLKMFIEVPVGKPSEISVENRLFLLSHPGQENVIHFKGNSGEMKTQVCTVRRGKVVFGAG